MKFLRVALLIAAVGASLVARADMTWTFAVQLSAAVNADPARVELKWVKDIFPVRDYLVSRKAVDAKEWADSVTLPGDASSYTDNDVQLGQTYEYQVICRAVAYTAYGYITVGINAPLVDARGRVILVVDRSVADPLGTELKRFEADLAGDGWTVVRQDVDRDASPVAVKEGIRAEWLADKENTRAAILFGHVPVVKSGNLNVDGHASRPMPADVFYADLDGEWTDVNHDGIYDQSTLPSDAELMIGRVDFADLPGKYSPVRYASEIDLLRHYLEKDHAFRHAQVRPAKRALVGNAVGDGGGQAYAASGYRNFAALVGAENVVTANSDLTAPADQRWISQLAAADYLWAYGCGAGSDFTVGGLGLHGQYNDFWASDFVEKKARGTFYLMFGSWFAEWNKPDNVLRTALASPDYGLAAAWSGRPHLFFHHMGVGEPIGYGIRLSQNNRGLYQNQVQRQLRGVHIALLGDPTLRMSPIAPPTDVTTSQEGGNMVVRWKASADSDTVVGYHIYRAASERGPYIRVTDTPVGGGSFTDTQPREGGASLYQVRAVALLVGPSGSSYQTSQGVGP